MKYRIALSSIAALSVALSLPAFAQNNDTNADQAGAQTPIRGAHEAMRMVAARAALEKTLDADHLSTGSQFRAKLTSKVQLENGPELPSGTMLLGEVAADDMNVAGTSKVALRFTNAVLKDGQNVPIKATIVGIFNPQTDSQGVPTQVPNSWNDGTLAIDQIGVVSGVDLHSRIASHNSGVFVSSTKHNVKLAASSEIQLAIAARNQGSQGMNGSGGNQ